MHRLVFAVLAGAIVAVTGSIPALADGLDLQTLTAPPLSFVLAGSVPLVLLVAAVLYMMARRSGHPEPQPVTALEMAAPVSRKQITEVREAGPVIEVLDESAAEFHPLAGMIRIGRHEDNEVRLAHPTVHRYHAVLHVTPNQGHVITDLSGPEGNGVVVNSQRVEQAVLAPGDLIELGEVKLRFRMGSASSSGI